jgi:hypothetical protein
MYRKYPGYAEDIYRGEIDLADWLIRKALRKFRFAAAAAIFAHIARSDLKFGLTGFLPALLRRVGKKMRGGPQPDTLPQSPTSFPTRAPSEAGS